MQLSTVYMYACKTAINISKIIIQPSKNSGIKPNIFIITIKPANIFKTTWPTTILATRRIDRLNGFDNNEINSIGIINGANGQGTPLGKNVLNYPHFFFFTPTHILKLNANKERVPTAAKCDVKVKL